MRRQIETYLLLSNFTISHFTPKLSPCICWTRLQTRSLWHEDVQVILAWARNHMPQVQGVRLFIMWSPKENLCHVVLLWLKKGVKGKAIFWWLKNTRVSKRLSFTAKQSSNLGCIVLWSNLLQNSLRLEHFMWTMWWDARGHTWGQQVDCWKQLQVVEKAHHYMCSYHSYTHIHASQFLAWYSNSKATGMATYISFIHLYCTYLLTSIYYTYIHIHVAI